MKINQKIRLFGLMLSILSFSVNGQICISEVMVNPNNGRLPAYEYIELYNRGTESFSLVGYKLQVGNASSLLPDLYLAPKQYLILVSPAAEDAFSIFGNVAVLSPWRMLNNTEGTIRLITTTGVVHDELHYSHDWYATPSKRQGGWSLERVDPHYLCAIAANWRESLADMGGSPGQRNSVAQDKFVPALGAYVEIVEEKTLRLGFALPIALLPTLSPLNFQIEEPSLHVVKVDQDSNELVLRLSAALPLGKVINLNLVDLHYCGLNYQETLPLFRPLAIDFHDVIINEVLFNPKVGGVDFVEIYNRSQKIINLESWLLGDKRISNRPYFLEPAMFCVLTTSAVLVQQDYPRAAIDRFLVMPALPAYPNDKGFVVLKNSAGLLIDSLFYTSAMHQPFLVNTKGISLERQGYDLETNAAGTFSSAAVLAGGATPGFINSLFKSPQGGKNTIFLQSQTFSPNGDGHEDYLVLDYAFVLDNAMLNVTIYNDRGVETKRLVRNKSAGRRGEIRWDGFNTHGKPSPSGIYVCYVELYNSAGHFQTFKEGFVLLNPLISY